MSTVREKELSKSSRGWTSVTSTALESKWLEVTALKLWVAKLKNAEVVLKPSPANP